MRKIRILIIFNFLTISRQFTRNMFSLGCSSRRCALRYMRLDRTNIFSRRLIDLIASLYLLRCSKSCGRTSKLILSVCPCCVHYVCCVYSKLPPIGRRWEIWWFHFSIRCDRFFHCSSSCFSSSWYLQCSACNCSVSAFALLGNQSIDFYRHGCIGEKMFIFF